MKDFILEKIKKLPQKPGVYLFRGVLGEVIYVGKAVRLRSRVRSHFREGNGSLKSKAMLEAIADVDFIPLRSEQEALVLESQYIKEFKPKYNVALRDDKGYPFLKVTFAESFPRFLITRLKKPDGALYLGPYTEAAALRKTVDQLQKIFRIRTCVYVEPGKKEYDHCLYQMMKWCSAPCVGKISREDYRRSVEDAVQVLLGRSGDLIRRLHRQMDEASRRMEYEKAARLRDQLRSLEAIVGTRTRSIQKFKRISSHADEEAQELAKVLGLDKPPERMEAFDISNLFGSEAVGSMVHFYRGRPDKRFYRRFKIRTVTGIDDFAMMREVVARRYRRLKEEGGALPDLVLVDGGKGQLASALEALRQLGLEAIPAIGLAKRYEEIFTPHGRESLRLNHDSFALHLIQRIRDEAHRFAVTYHKSLRAKKLKESILDDIPGVGPAKKGMLLKTFGSVERLGRSSVETMAKVKGISMNLAKQIYSSLHAAS